MRHVEKTALLPYSAEQIYLIVADVPHYREFLPWCSGSSIVVHNETELIGELELSAPGVKQTFRTQNQLSPYNKITMSLLEGPFSHLQGEWNFKQLGSDGCRVSMSMQFEFNHQLVERTFGRVFSMAAEKLVVAFSQRADEIYGG